MQFFGHFGVSNTSIWENKTKPRRRFPGFKQYSAMEKDEYNRIAAKALRARLNGDGKRASQFEQELQKLRNGEGKHESKSWSSRILSVVGVESSNKGPVEIVSPLDENGNLLPSLLKKVTICERSHGIERVQGG